jgi:O-antigen biosynthesis protein
MPSYSVLMPVFNASQIAARALRYLVQSGVETSRILVCDDCSDEPSMGEVKRWARSTGIDWRESQQNLGYTRNINRGLKTLASDFVLIINSDCFISAESIQKLCGVLERFDVVGCVGPLSSNAGHQSVQLPRELHWQSLSAEEILHFARKIEGQLADEFGLRPWLVPSANGFCCLWRLEALQGIGYFDEEEFPRGYGEEDDACLRLLEAGSFPAVAPFVFAPHLKTQSFSIKERTALKTAAKNKLRLKFSNAYIDRLIEHYERSPLFGELRSIALGK